MSASAADANLLFSVVAYQNGLLDPVQFVESCAVVSSQPDVADWLAERGWLGAEARDCVEREVARLVGESAGDLRACLDRFVGDDRIRQTVQRLTLDSALQPNPALPAVPEPTASTGGVRGCVDTALVEDRVPRPLRQRYVLLGGAKEGGIGRVWRARDTHLGRDVALKELRRDRLLSEVHRARFLAEAKVTAQLTHPNIVPAFELSVDGDQTFLTMQYVEGRTLTEAVLDYHEKRRRNEAGALEQRSLLNALVAVCKAVDYAHDRGVLHRDLKGPNVILGNHGEVFLLDWGMAKVLGEAESCKAPVALGNADSDAETVQGELLGTPPYMAPEQVAGRVDLIDRRTDVYALGVILFEILTGRLPFSVAQEPPSGEALPHQPEERLLAWNRRRRERLYFMIQNDAPPAPRLLDSGVPRALEEVCLKCLAKKRDDRYATARELADELERWLADEPVRVCREPMFPRLLRLARRRRVLVASLAALLLAALPLVAMLAVVTARSREDLARANAELALASVQLGEAKQVAEISRRRAAEEEENQRRLAEAALAALRLFVDDFQAYLEDRPGMHRARRQMLELAAGKLDALVPLLAPSSETRQLMLAARIHLGELYLLSEEPSKARPHLAQAHEEARRWHEEDRSRPQPLELLSRARAGLGAVATAAGQGEAARLHYEETIRSLAAFAPKTVAMKLALIEARRSLADCHLLLDDHEAALAQLALAREASLALREAGLADFVDRRLSRVHLDLASVWLSRGGFDAAAAELSLASKLIAFDPRSVQARRDSAQLDELLGRLQLARSLAARPGEFVARPGDADYADHLARSHDKRAALLEDDRDSARAASELARVCHWRAVDFLHRRQLDQADRFFRKSHSLWEELPVTRLEAAHLLDPWASTCLAWGRFLLDAGDLAAARILLERSLEQRERLLKLHLQNPRLQRLASEASVAIAMLCFREGHADKCLDLLLTTRKHSSFTRLPDALQAESQRHIRLCQAHLIGARPDPKAAPEDAADLLLCAVRAHLHEKRHENAFLCAIELAAHVGDNPLLWTRLAEAYGHCHAALDSVDIPSLAEPARGFARQLTPKLVALLCRWAESPDPFARLQLATHIAFKSARELAEVRRLLP